MIGLLIITHSRLAKELLEATRFIVGSVKAAECISIETSKDSKKLRHRSLRKYLVNSRKKSLREPDPVDQGALETDKALKLKTHNRYIKLIDKINNALGRIKDGTYGCCEGTVTEIGIQRLEAEPTATLTLEAQKRHGQMERRSQNLHRKRIPLKGGEIMEDYKIDDLVGI